MNIEYACPHCDEHVINTFADDTLHDGDDFIVSCTFCKKDAIIWIYYRASKLGNKEDEQL